MSDKVTSFIPDAIREAANTIAAAIQGGGGSSVEWTQIITTGTKIAVITINGETTEVYAPAGGGGGSSVSWNEIQTTGTKIAQITIDGTTYDVYAPNVSVSAADVSYDNTTSGLSADDAQEAIDELAGGLSTVAGVVSGHTTDIGNLQTSVASKTDQSMIAPVETMATASQSYAIGEQFILNGTLYTATAAITAGGTITIGGNCTASDTVTEQIANINGSYSENEHIVGKWINGKTAYEKTINIGALPNATTKTVAHNISNLSWVISLNGMCFGSNTYLPLPFVDQLNINNNIRIDCNATNISIRASGNYSSFSGYVTMR